MNSPAVRVGLERCLEDPPEVLGGARFGLLMNQASVDHRFRYACDLLAERFPGQLGAIFSPQHGLWCEEQANMIESPHARYAPLNLPVFSLYSETRRPTPEMLAGLDCLVIDLQDVGTRVYTFAWTILECLKACAEATIKVVLLDRPNPIGGTAEGPFLFPAYHSFVGGATIPLRHGLTLGELSLLMKAQHSIECDLTVVPMEGWQRSMLFGDTGRAWVAPSPNMPKWETALLYPGQVLLEGTNLSEGRGTTLPFELVGAPFIDPFLLADELSAREHPGVVLRPVRFVPTFDKWQGQTCGGVMIHVVDAQAVRSVRWTIDLLSTVRRLYGEAFQWLPPPYEYEREKPPIDILYGSAALRATIDEGRDASHLAQLDSELWQRRVAEFLLYDEH